MKIPVPVEEHKFCSTRKWKFDFAYLDKRLAIEIEGGVWGKGGGRHNRGQGFVNDMEKYNMAVELGWKLLRYQPNLVDYGQIKRTLLGMNFDS